MATIILRHTQKYNSLIASDLMIKDYWYADIDIDRMFFNWIKMEYKEHFDFFENFEKINPHIKIYVEGTYYKEL